MTHEPRHVSVRIERPAQEVYDFCAEPANLPRWASGIGESIENVDGHWMAESPSIGRVEVQFAPRNPHGVLDHLVTLADGQTFLNRMRVVSRGDGAADVVFTLRWVHGMNAETFEADAALIAADLQTLKALLESGAD